MKINALTRSDFIRGISGLLRMEGAAVTCFAGGLGGLLTSLTSVTVLSVIVYLLLAPIVPQLHVDAWNIVRAGLTELCQYLVILNILQVAAEKLGRQDQWSQCAVTVLWATAVANFLTMIAVLIGRAVNHFIVHDGSFETLFLTGVFLGLSLFLIVTMCRVIHFALKVSWRQVAFIMLSSLFFSMLVVQLAALFTSDLNASSLTHRADPPSAQRAP